jgi:hypothetical protein
MRNVFILAAAAAMAAGVAAAETNGSMELEINKDAETTLTLGVGLSAGELAFGNFSVESVDGGNFALDQWQLGTTVGALTVAIGDQDGVFVEGTDYTTLEEPAMAESLQVSMGDAQVALGFTDLSADATDISNVQGAYTLNMNALTVTATGDYNFNSEDWLAGGRASGVEIAGVALGAAATYGSANETFAYEVDGTVMGITAYVNGDQNDALQNVGAGYGRAVAGLDFRADVNYNIDTEEFTPTAGISFNF